MEFLVSDLGGCDADLGGCDAAFSGFQLNRIAPTTINNTKHTLTLVGRLLTTCPKYQPISSFRRPQVLGQYVPRI